MIEHLRYALKLVEYARDALREAELALANFRNLCYEHRDVVHESWLYCAAEWGWLLHAVEERVQSLSKVLLRKLDRLEGEGEAARPTPPGGREPGAREAGEEP